MTDQIDLGQKTPDSPNTVPAQVGTDQPKVTYPTFTVRDAVAKEVSDALGISATGEEFQLSVRVSVSGLRDDEYGRSVDFKVMSLAECECNDAGNTSEMGGDEEEEEAEDSPMVKAAKSLKKA